MLKGKDKLMKKIKSSDCKYKVDLSRILGKGGFGTVYHATESNYGIEYAAKKIHVSDRRVQDRISIEMLKMLELRHNNIVTVHDVVRDEATVWVFMEKCQHGDLNKFFEKQELTMKIKLKFMMDIGKGVKYLHERNIVHRDIKPGNILVQSRSGTLIAKLTDFDLSKCIEDDVHTKQMATNVGTPAYKAPEFFMRTASGTLIYHPNVDIYATGLTFLAMIQGNKPLKPRIETYKSTSELKEIIGGLVAKRMKFGLSPRDVVPDKNCSGLCGLLPRPPPRGEKPRAASEGGFEVQIRRLIQRMTRAKPEERLSAAQVVRDLSFVRKNKNSSTTAVQPERASPKPATPDLIEVEPGTNKASQFVTMRRIATHDTGLVGWGRTKMCVLPSEEVVLWGKASHGDIPALHFYSDGSTVWVCRHEDEVSLLPLTIDDQHFLIVSCWDCRRIRLINPRTKESTVVLYDPSLRLNRMCHGENGQLFVGHSVKGSVQIPQVMTSIQIFEVNKCAQSGATGFHSMCHVPEQKLTLLSIPSKGIVRAVSSETEEMVWETKGPKFGSELEPHGIVFSSKLEALLVADGRNGRILVISASTGNCTQAIPLGQGVECLWELQWHNDHLLVHHCTPGKHFVSIFSVN